MREHDLVIIGGGVAGLTAGMYARRYGLDAVLLERLMTGGQVINAERIENFPGFPEGVSGAEIGPLVQEQAIRQGLEIELSEVTGLRQEGSRWLTETLQGEVASKAVIVAGGSTLRTLGVPGEAELHGAGVSYCATCDGAFFMDQTVGVAGGGDSALDEAITLTEYASRVLLLVRGRRARRPAGAPRPAWPPTRRSRCAATRR